MRIYYICHIPLGMQKPQLTTVKTASIEGYLILEELGGPGNDLSEILKKTSLLQIRSGLATAIESEAGATRIISEDDLGWDSSITQQNKGFKSIIVTECLTYTCRECTGSYINKILNHRLICRCSCGHTNNENSIDVYLHTGTNT